jgi:signal recognition particle receptor subunit beta
MDANVESLRNLEDNLSENGFELRTIPYALQLNKRDLPTAIPVDSMYRILNLKGEPTFETVAVQGMGVFETLKAVAKQVLYELRRR